MPEQPTNAHERYLRLILRIIGVSSLFAIPFIFVPFETMFAIHAELNMGDLPNTPIVNYLARSTSALYAIVGGLMVVVSFDLQRNRAVIAYIGRAFILFGMALLLVDWQYGMPLSWTLWEGPFIVVVGSIIAYLGAKVETE